MIENKKNKYQEAYEKNDNFFNDIYLTEEQGESFKINGVKYAYREDQHSYALDIMEAITNNAIMFIQAGVGIGKSMGYLIPMFSTYDSVENFNKIIISTSSIALQQQLLTDIQNLSNLLKIRPVVKIAKGANNYACLCKIHELIESDRIKSDMKEELKRILKEIEESKIVDKDQLNEISEKTWKKIQINSRKNCSNCKYAKKCYFKLEQKRISNANIIITNHAYISYLMRKKVELQEGKKTINNLLDGTSAIIFDEAHALEDNLRVEEELSYEDLKLLIMNLKNKVNGKIGIGLNNRVQELFEIIEKNTNEVLEKNRYIRKEEQEISEFIYNSELEEKIKQVIEGLKKAKQETLKELNPKQIPKMQELKLIDKYKKILEDILKQKDSKNIYYAKIFYDRRKQRKIFNIAYKVKKIKDIMSAMYKENIPIIFTSATLTDAEGNFKYTKDNLGINEIPIKKKIIDGEIFPSPYDFEENSLVYYNSNLPSPSTRNESVPKNLEYIKSLATEIDKLIRITEGKALILFTSKEDMNAVYNTLNNINYPFKLLLADTSNTDTIKQEFKEEVDSCLFATGAFWEGIDIKGSSLSNLIICHLPFPTVNPVVEYKASKFTEENRLKEVYLNEMIQKLNQGTGRLIRSESDRGIVCILDPRAEKYKEAIKTVLPFVNYTQNIEEVEEFSRKNITHKK